MKKENRRLAQQRREALRRKEVLRRRIRKALMVAVPAAAVLVIFLIANRPSSGAANAPEGSSAGADSSGSSGTETQSNTPALSSDTSLTVADGDTVNIDYVGSVDGVEFEGGNTHGGGTDLTIGSGRYIDDFEEQLIGHHPGDTVEVNVTFPENYGKEDLNGKDAVFVVTINGIYTGTAS